MTDESLNRCRILVVEDEYFLAEDLVEQLSDAGACIVGPAATVECALALLDSELHVDGAVLDVNLGGEAVFPLADTLMNRAVPLIFTTGYDPATLPRRFAQIPICSKPINPAHVTDVIRKAIHG